MGTFIRMLVMVLFLVLAPAPGAFARGGPGGVHGGFHGGDFGRGGGWRHGGFHEGFHRGFGHFHHPHFHSGIFFEVPPLWVVPAPYIGVTPAPPGVVLLLEPTGLLSHRAVLHCAVDPSLSTTIAAHSS
jgi:hypothetical protein